MAHPPPLFSKLPGDARAQARAAVRCFAAAVVVVAVALSGCGSDEPPAQACGMEEVAHVDPLPPPDSPFEYRYSEVAARGGIAYLGATRGAGVQIIDVAAGRSIGVLDAGLAGTINSVALDGNLLVFAAGGNGIVAYDVSDPRQPARRAHQREPVSYCHTVFVHRDLVACSTSSPDEPHLAFYRVVKPADPTAPLEIVAAGSYSEPLTPEEIQNEADILVHDVFVHERGSRILAYLAYWERGLHIVDVTDPARPQVVGRSAPTPTRWTHSVWVDGDFAYVGEESYHGLVRVFDVADPAAPVEIGQLRSSEGDAISAHNLQVAGGVLYVSWYQDGLRAFAARGAAAPAEIGWFHTWNGADNRANPGPSDARFAGNWDVFVDGDKIYAADMQTGLWVLRHPAGAASPPCPADRTRGTSAFAKAGRPPFGWTALLPRRLRPARTVPVFGVLGSVDPYFDLSDELARSLGPALGLAGARVGPTEVLPGPPGRAVSYRVVTSLVELPAALGPGSLPLSAALADEGVTRRLVRPVEVLPAAPPNRDLEPNEDEWTSGLLVPDAAGRATCPGLFEGGDRFDLYTLAPPGAARGLRIRLVTAPASAGAPGPAARLTVSRSSNGEQAFGDPVQQEISGQWEQAVTVPAGEQEPLLIGVDPISPAGDAPISYTLEASPP